MVTPLTDIDVSGISTQLGTTLGAAALIALVGWIGASWRAGRRRDAKIDRILQLFEGEPADPLADRPATLGVLGQINALSIRIAALETIVKGGQHD